MVFLVIAIFIILALSDFPQLIENKEWKTVVVLGGVYAIVLLLALLKSLNVTLPSPFVGIQDFIIDVLHLGYPEP